MTEIFNQVGPVKTFKLVLDPETGSGKGYGFCEFFDSETTAMAVRKLNNSELGPRKIRVEFPSNDPRRNQSYEYTERTDRYMEQQNAHESSYNSRFIPPVLHSTSSLPASQGGGMPSPAIYSSSMATNLNKNINSTSVPAYNFHNSMTSDFDSASQPHTDAYNARTFQYNKSSQNKGDYTSGTSISNPTSIPLAPSVVQVLSTFSAQELLNMLSKLQTVVHIAPEEARRLLIANPALPYAAFQAMLLMNLVDANVLQQVVVAVKNKNMHQPASATSSPPSVPQKIPSSNHKSQQANGSDQGNEEKRVRFFFFFFALTKQMALIQQLLALTPEQINALPPAQRDQILSIRRQHFRQ